MSAPLRTSSTAAAMSGPSSRSCSTNGTRARIASCTARVAGPASSGARRSSACAAPSASSATHDLRVVDDGAGVPRGGHPHADVILLAGARRDRVHRRRVRERLALRHQRRRRVLDEHEAAVEPALRHEERRQPVGPRRVEQAVQATVADRCERDERQRQCVQRDRDRHPVEVAAAADVAVVPARSGCPRRRSPRSRARPPTCAAVSRDAPCTCGVQRKEYASCTRCGESRWDSRIGGVLQQPAEVRRRRRLAGMRPERVETFVERGVGSERRLDRHRRDDVGGAEQPRPRARAP